MLEYTKSLGSFSWALALTGADQTLELLKDPNPEADDLSVRKLEGLSSAMEGTLGAYLRGLYTAGDQLQRNSWDFAFAVATFEAASPGRAIDLSSEWVRSSIDLLRAAIPGGEETDASGQPCGWGAMPSDS